MRRIKSPRLLQKDFLASEDYIISADILRTKIERILKSVVAMTEIPGASAVRMTDQVGLADLRANLEDLNRFKVEPLISLIRESGLSRNPSRIGQYFEGRLVEVQLARTEAEQRIKSMDAQDLVFKVIVPSVEEIEIRDGVKRTVPRKIFPGYVLVQMITLKQEDAAASEQDKAVSSKAWMVVRNSPGVTGFVGSGTAPTPLDRSEVQSIMKQMKADEPRVKLVFQPGQSVRVIDGPFTDFVGTVEEINMEKGRVKVAVSILGRETPVELDFLQVDRL